MPPAGENLKKTSGKRRRRQERRRHGDVVRDVIAVTSQSGIATIS